jgi:hypothetical protein
MCVVSMIGDHFDDKWRPLFPPQMPTIPAPAIVDWEKLFNPPPTKADYDALKKEVEEMKELLKKALEYDKKNNEPHCEIEEKMAILKAVAKGMGVDLNEIFKDK